MFNVIIVKAPEYLRTHVEMVQLRYPTRAGNTVCIMPRVKGCGQTSFVCPGKTAELGMTTHSIMYLRDRKLQMRFYQ